IVLVLYYIYPIFYSFIG
ncbi:hypothetical protein B7997_13355, partial [Staphylococcus aureus]